MGFLDDYQPVEDRLRQFWDDHAQGRIVTDLVRAEAGEFIVEASVWRDAPHLLIASKMSDAADADLRAVFETPDATGYAQEHQEDRGVNAKSALENCETSAIGRALANLGYAPKGARPSREEMSKAAPSAESPLDDDYVCPACGAPVQNNLPEHFNDSKKPAFRCSNRTCQGGGKKKQGSGNWPWATWDANHFQQPAEEEGEPERIDYETGELLDYPPGEEPFG